MSATITQPVSTPPPPAPLLTAEEFIGRYGDCSGVELVRGRVVWEERPVEPAGVGSTSKFRHGVVSYRAVRLLSDFVEAHRLGRIAINDTFVRTATDPETVRGADVLFVSFARLPPGATPDDLAVPPDLVVEVRSPSDRWRAVAGKAIEYLDAGVTVVLVVDPAPRTVTVYRAESEPQEFTAADTLTVPDVLPGFGVPVASLFE